MIWAPRLSRGLLLGLILSLSACATVSRPGAESSATQSFRFCVPPQTASAADQQLLFQFAGHVRRMLSQAGARAAIVSRTGIDLPRLGIRFTHSGIAMQTESALGWRVRQLYYACDDARPGLFDQGIGGFLFGSDNPQTRHVAILLLPEAESEELFKAAGDDALALGLLGARYSANAYPFSVNYQNCNQWVLEMLAAAWGGLRTGNDLRSAAQRWLAENRYQPEPVRLPSYWLKFVASFSPMVHLDDHPAAQRDGLDFQISLPRTIESFIRARYPATQRIELCHNRDQLVIRHGWEPIAPGCLPRANDQVMPLS